MRVFITGASGFIGQAVVNEFLSNGHQVLALARSDETAASLSALDGVEVIRGSLDDLDSLKRGAAASDGVVHLAFNHDFSDFIGACALDRRAIAAMGEALAGSNRPLVVTSGTGLLPPGRMATEDDGADMSSPFGSARGESEKLALSLTAKGVRSCVVRLPPTNHGKGDKGFIPALINIARQKGVAAYIGDGLSRWPTTHRLDTARAFYLAFTKGTAGSVYHVVAVEGVPIKEIAEIIGKKLNLPVVSKKWEEAQEHFGFLAFLLSTDHPASSAKTREALGWKPTHPTLIADLEEGFYFS
ncbi:hypothetical protein MPDQ_000600 [Monascus purpureus]|uniref:NAD-dependent epimerase/dehydratase domain-containing protein n=1 Tax=Monascus purpureus TaxID=5098 RepID=A0A507QPL3_MONPU|nr:hypothetical protein MPDQ_000600 [Monascus purpureus]BDD63683.1 hypothetical protein MAP00_008551 [Monascus purpureus]